METDKRIKEILDIRSRLFDIANSYAVEGVGDAGLFLHQSCNNILFAKEAVEGKLGNSALREKMRAYSDATSFPLIS